jgi:hypothetical protein
VKRIGLLISILAMAAACGWRRQAPPPAAASSAQALPAVPDLSPWPAALRQAQRAAEAGDFATADRVLATFGAAHPRSADGAEADFFRALFKTDPANQTTTIREQLAAFDAYLMGGDAVPRYGEALILRRLVETSDSLRAVVQAVRTTADARAKAKEDEIRRLADLLERTTAELERIKRRLARP